MGEDINGMIERELTQAKQFREMKVFLLEVQDANGDVGYNVSEIDGWYHVMLDADVWEEWQARIEHILKEDT